MRASEGLCRTKARSPSAQKARSGLRISDRRRTLKALTSGPGARIREMIATRSRSGTRTGGATETAKTPGPTPEPRTGTCVIIAAAAGPARGGGGRIARPFEAALPAVQGSICAEPASSLAMRCSSVFRIFKAADVSVLRATVSC